MANNLVDTHTDTEYTDTYKQTHRQRKLLPVATVNRQLLLHFDGALNCVKI